jgi:Bacterial Ig-like domain (group 2)
VRLPSRAAAIAGTAALFTLAACSGGPTEPSTPVARVDVSGAPSENVLLVGATAQLQAVPRDAGGTPPDRRVRWSSTDGSIATVSSTGLVTAVSSGVVGIIAEAGGEEGVVGIAVRVAVSVPAAGAAAPVTTSLFNNALSLRIPPGATAVPTLTVGRALIITDDARLLTATAFAIGPATITFTAPVIAEVSVNLAAIPAAKRAGLRIFRVTALGDLEGVAGGSVDLGRSVVIAPLTSAGTYVVLVPGDATILQPAEGTSRRVPVGTAVPGVGVIARDAAGNPVAGASIEFSIEGASGSIVGDTIALTDVTGRADLPGQWIAGPAKGNYALRARLLGAPLSVQFTATAFAPAVALRITSAPTAGLSGVMLVGAIPVEIVDANGERAEETQPVTLSLIGGNGSLAGTTVETAVLGGAIFQGQTISGPGTYRFVVSSAGLLPDTSAEVAIAQQVAFVELRTQPDGAVSGIALTTQPVVELLDNARIPVSNASSAVTASLLGSGQLLGTRTVQAVDGVATFTNLAIEGAGTTLLNFTVSTPDGPENIVSNDVVVAPAPPGVRILVGAQLVQSVIPNQSFGVPINVDLSNRGGANIRSLDVTVTWDPARFDYFDRFAGSWSDSTGGASTITVDESQVAAGILRFTGSTPGGTIASFMLGMASLRTLGTAQPVEATITAVVNAATNAAGAPLNIVVLPMSVTVYPSP